MESHLDWMLEIQDSPGHGTTVRMMAPSHPENMATHDALVRRGMVAVDEEGHTRVTAEGRRARGR